MHSSRSKQKYEKSALRISITGSTIFVILEIVMAVITRSQAVLLDSVYAVSYTHLRAHET